jgi:hypothetical protein
MHERLEAFALQIPDFSSRSAADLIDHFVYFITVLEKESVATAAGVERCFEVLRIPKYSNIPTYLSRHSKRGGTCKFVKAANGYQLSRNVQLEIQKTLHSGPAKIETSHLLRGLVPRLSDPLERQFLQEVIDCYEIGARRASIVMTWLLTINHLCTYIHSNALPAFNAVLSKNTDKRVKISSVSNFDDFSDIPESKLIEFARSANIISNDVRKILDTKLGIRNTSAHPSAIFISEVKATDFIIDLIENVILKYPK